jgi:GNAT superfamily N-acetyltransferase
MTANSATFAIEDEPSRDDIAALEHAIYTFNMERTGHTDGRYLAIFLKDETGKLTAGISGHTWGGVCEIQLLWISEAMRHKGLGSRLIAAAEDEARRRGCDKLVLSTYSFQAPAFYAARGYVQHGHIAGYPQRHESFLLVKDLTA